MKKKGKIFGTISALAISTAMMAVGVMAASQVSLNVSSSVSFQATGVYVKVNGQIQQGASTDSLTNATEPENSDYTYIGYSYDAITEQTETGATATTYDDTPVGTASNDALPGWAIGDISFSENNLVVRYNFTFTNYSEFVVNASITNYSAADGSTPALTGIFDSFGDSVAVEESVTGGIIQVPARSDTSPGTAKYTITFTLNKFTSGLTQDLAINFRFEEYKEPEAVQDYFSFNGSSLTGLSEVYLNLPVKPDTLVVPDTAEDGTPITSVGSGFRSPFQGLESSNVILEEGITQIGRFAFNNCASLKSITIKGNITSIGSFSFASCSNLATIIFESATTPPRLSNTAFEGGVGAGLTHIYVPAESVEVYKTHVSENSSLTSWSYYADIIYPLP